MVSEGCCDEWVKVDSVEWARDKDLGSEVAINTNNVLCNPLSKYLMLN